MLIWRPLVEASLPDYLSSTKRERCFGKLSMTFYGKFANARTSLQLNYFSVSSQVELAKRTSAP